MVAPTRRERAMPRKPPRPHDRRQTGISLIEQIMVIAIVGILAAIAMPALGSLLQRNQVQAAQLDFIAALHHARGLAVTAGRFAHFCPSNDGLHCAGTSRWDAGWLIGHPARHKNEPDPAPARARAGYTGITILGDAGRKLTRFRADGTASGSTNTWRFCRKGRTEQALVVIVSNSGRVRAAPATAEQAASCAAAP